MLFLLVCAVLVGALGLSVTALQALVAQSSFRTQDLTRRDATLRQEYGRLRLQVAELTSPGRIARDARAVGLRLPDPTAVKVIRVRMGKGASPGDSESSPSFALKGVLGGSE